MGDPQLSRGNTWNRERFYLLRSLRYLTFSFAWETLFQPATFWGLGVKHHKIVMLQFLTPQ